MSKASDKDEILVRLRDEGPIDVTQYVIEDQEFYNLFIDYQADLEHDGYITVVDVQRGHVIIDATQIALTKAGTVFINNSGYVAKQEKENQELQDKLMAQKALIDTARWQAKGVIITSALGLITIIITGWTAYMTYIDDRTGREQQSKRIATLERKLTLLDSIRTDAKSKLPSITPKLK